MEYCYLDTDKCISSYKMVMNKMDIQCPNCQCWFTQQKSFKHHIRHCRRSNDAQTFYNVENTVAIPLLSNGGSKPVFSAERSNLFNNDSGRKVVKTASLLSYDV